MPRTPKQLDPEKRPKKHHLKKASFTHWCLTVNNPTDKIFYDIFSTLSQSGRGGSCSYAVLGVEHGDQDYTEHYQIYIELYQKGIGPTGRSLRHGP